MRWCCFRQPSAGQADGEESTSNPAVAPADGYTSFADLELGHDELGRGQYGRVVRATHVSDRGAAFAVKICDAKRMGASAAADLRREVAILSALRHAHVVRCYDCAEEKGAVFIVLELVAGGELFDRLVERTRYAEAEARACARVLLDALAYVHSRGVAHRDVKPENLLLASRANDHDVKLADFGFAADASAADLTAPCGTPNYVAPEILARARYGVEVDAWSAGVLVFILLGGYMPFDDAEIGVAAMYERIGRAEYAFDPDPFDHVSDAAKSLVRQLLVVDRAKRSSTRAALEHPWFAESAECATCQHELAQTLRHMKHWNAKRKLKGATRAIIAQGRLTKLASDHEAEWAASAQVSADAVMAELSDSGDD